VTVGTWLGQSLHFSGQQIALAAGTTAIGAIVSPFFVGLIADKVFATQKVLAALPAIGAMLLLLAASRSSFAPLYVLILLYALCYMPTLALTKAFATICSFVAGQIYVDRHAPLALRAAAQGLVTLITYGLGMLLGSWLSGLVADHYAYRKFGDPVMHYWHSIWIVSWRAQRQPSCFSSSHSLSRTVKLPSQSTWRKMCQEVRRCEGRYR
jgi:MFS family permease